MGRLQLGDFSGGLVCIKEFVMFLLHSFLQASKSSNEDTEDDLVAVFLIANIMICFNLNFLFSFRGEKDSFLP